MGRRGYGVRTATAQMEVIGKRHFGLKALPHGGGGGRQATRELFDTLLLWHGRVPLDANGNAAVEVPLNDSLTSFRIVAVATGGVGQFGTGATEIRSTQDLMLLSGLPPLVRQGDRFPAQFTVRNTTDQPLHGRACRRVSAEGAATARRCRRRTSSSPPARRRSSTGRSRCRRRRHAALRRSRPAPPATPPIALAVTQQRAAGGAGAHAAGDAAARRASRSAHAGRSGRPTRCPTAAASTSLGDRLARRRARRRRRLAAPLSVQLPRAAGVARRRPRRRGALDGDRRRPALVHRRRRPAEVLPDHERGQRGAHRLRAVDRRRAPGWTLPDATQRQDDQRPARLRRRPRHAATARCAAPDLTLRKLAAIEALARAGSVDAGVARQHHHRAEPVADVGGARLVEHPAARRRRPRPRCPARRRRADRCARASTCRARRWASPASAPTSSGG